MAQTALRAATIGKLEDFYPSPFFDIASQYIPKTIKALFKWCVFYQLTNPVINAVVAKLAVYPITELVYEGENAALNKKYKDFLEKILNLRVFLTETNLDRYTFGNSFTSVSFPIDKMLTCRSCKDTQKASKSSYVWRNYQFVITCKKCEHSGPARVKDEPSPNYRKTRLIRWNPDHIEIKVNEITGETKYFYKVPTVLRNAITLGKPDVVEQVPQAFIDAVRLKRTIVLDPEKVYHTKRPSISRDLTDAGWGTPLILPVLKDAFFIQVLKKAQEAIALQNIVPFRVLFPQITTDGSNPFQHVNLKDWQNEVVTQIKRWKRDSNYIAVTPTPIGAQVVGGEGKMMLLHQEVRMYSEMLVAGMGVPVGFYYGESQYSGASINLRALENEFQGNREDMHRLVEFIVTQISKYMKQPAVPTRFKPFKMADDLQRASFDLQQVQMRIMSKSTFAQSRDMSYDDEKELIDTETDHDLEFTRKQMEAQMDMQGKGIVTNAKYSIEAQKIQAKAQAENPELAAMAQPQMPQQAPEAMGGESPVGAQPAGAPLGDQVESLAQEMSALTKEDRYNVLTQLKSENPELYSMVNQRLAQLQPHQPFQQPLPTMAGTPPMTPS